MGTVEGVKRGLVYFDKLFVFVLRQTRIRSVERGICPIDAQTVTFRLPRTSVSRHMGVYYAEKVAH